MKPKTVQQWLDLPEDERALEFAEVLTPGPRKHKWEKCVCTNCGKPDSSVMDKVQGICFDKACSVPDPITIDWNTAMEWFRKQDRSCSWDAMWRIFKESDYARAISMSSWLLHIAEPKYYLIAAAMAMGRKEE